MQAVVAFGALAVLLIVVARGLDARVELAVAVGGAGIVLVTGATTGSGAADALARLGPTIGFLAAIFVISEVARLAGLFDVAGAVLRRDAASGRAVVIGVAMMAAAITAVLSLDATAVLFTPVVIGVVAQRRSVRTPALLTTVEMSNASSLLLPVSNLTNLLVFRSTGLSFAGFGLRMAAPTALAVAVVTWSGVRSIDAGADSDETHSKVEAPTLDGFGVGVAVGIAVMLVAFLVSSVAGIEPVWVAAAAAIVLGLVAVVSGRLSLERAVEAVAPGFLIFVAALGIVVGAAQGHGLDRVMRAVLPGGEGFLSLLAIAALAAVLANLVNNLPATLVLMTVIPGAAVARLLALLVGVNVGPNLTYTGSLATLLWRREVRKANVEPAKREFYRMALVATPLALATATAALWISLRVFN